MHAEEVVMDLFLVQHGEALPESLDPERPLSDAGRAAVERLSRLLAMLQMRPRQLVCSPKRRSRQTAEIIRRCLGQDASVLLESEAFVPGAPPERMTAELERLHGRSPVLIAGHLPSLGRLAGYLLAGEDRPVCEFRNAGLCWIRTEGLPLAGSGTLVALLPPEMVAVLAGGHGSP
ncbi:MAG TPA: hypothetical protein EYP62_01930 [Kiritimatiellae bacterium]|nr:hypothetical protein [Kiritimatiellia bacterium]